MKRLAILLAAMLLAPSAGADAALITFTETTTGTGSLAGKSFTAATITFSETVDTTSTSAGSFMNSTSGYFLDLTSTVSVDGIGTASFTGSTFNVITLITPTSPFSPTQIALGLGTPGGGGFVIYSFTAAGNQTNFYRVSSGPLANNPGGNLQSSIATSAGLLTIDSIGSAGSFQSALAPVPEPSSLALCGIAGMAGLMIARARRRAA